MSASTHRLLCQKDERYTLKHSCLWVECCTLSQDGHKHERLGKDVGVSLPVKAEGHQSKAWPSVISIWPPSQKAVESGYTLVTWYTRPQELLCGLTSQHPRRAGIPPASLSLYLYPTFASLLGTMGHSISRHRNSVIVKNPCQGWAAGGPGSPPPLTQTVKSFSFHYNLRQTVACSSDYCERVFSVLTSPWVEPFSETKKCCSRGQPVSTPLHTQPRQAKCRAAAVVP
ncbi:hypothetical protein O3P69_017998 [Scylla paramamosain]|uniref:Uncharacterized protein n=1 Tax=Scylla paramamosain TaxID=85552 RepID=A0AAW0TK11_SCYPA